MRSLEDKALRPEYGDVVIMRNGHVRYHVISAAEKVVVVDRTSVREHVFDGEHQLMIPRAAWRDLVYFGAVS